MMKLCNTCNKKHQERSSKFCSPTCKASYKSINLDNECLESQAKEDRSGNIYVIWKNKQIYARRNIYESYYNEKLPHNMTISSTCGNKKCTNINHLLKTSISDQINNARSKVKRKLSHSDIEEIKELFFENKWSCVQIGIKYGVSDTAIRKLINKNFGDPLQEENIIDDDEQFNQEMLNILGEIKSYKK